MKRYVSLSILLLFYIWILHFSANGSYSAQAGENQIGIQQEASLYAGFVQPYSELVTTEEQAQLIEALTLEEDEVYTFLQGPRAWSENIPWSGEWCGFGVRGNSFGGFGCGLCCMASIYDTLSPYEVSPWQMCTYAREISGYAPSWKSGAIGWGDMKMVLQACGFTCDLYYKPDTYEAFQQHAKKMETAIVLVCSAEDDTYWQDTPGHYVNIWLYEEGTDTVFLGEPGRPEKNRCRIPLRYIYDALKVSSKYQYLAIDTYEEESNQWKEDGIEENWNRPL